MKRNQSAVSSWLLSSCLIGFSLFCGTSVLAQDVGIDGTYRLVSRKLPDGSTLAPPAVMGLFTLSKGQRNLNVFWQTPDGKPASFSLAATYKLTHSDYTQTLLFSVFNDPSSGQPVAYSLAGETTSVPVKREGRRVQFTLPSGEPEIVFDGESLVATVNGVFVDYWEKVK